MLNTNENSANPAKTYLRKILYPKKFYVHEIAAVTLLKIKKKKKNP